MDVKPTDPWMSSWHFLWREGDPALRCIMITASWQTIRTGLQNRSVQCNTAKSWNSDQNVQQCNSNVQNVPVTPGRRVVWQWNQEDTTRNQHIDMMNCSVARCVSVRRHRIQCASTISCDKSYYKLVNSVDAADWSLWSELNNRFVEHHTSGVRLGRCRATKYFELYCNTDRKN